MMTDAASNTIGQTQALGDEIRHLGPWFHNLHLPGGVRTAPDHWMGDFPAVAWRLFEMHIPPDLSGWRCLDIGCNAGFYSFELARRGASMLGIDVDEHYLRQARWAARQLDLEDRIDFRRMQVYELARMRQRFDLVLFLGVFYHLRYPMLGLDIAARKTERLMVFQTLTVPGEERFSSTHGRSLDERHLLRDPGWPKLAFIEHALAGDPTNWWVPNVACVEAMLRSAGMRIAQRPAQEICICTPDPQSAAAMKWQEPELLAATGQQYAQ